MGFLGFGKKKDTAPAVPKEEEAVATEESQAGRFIGLVLLSKPEWDKQRFQKDFFSDWGINVEEEESSDDKENNDVLLFDHDNMRVIMGFMPGPVPDGEAEFYAGANYLWKDAVTVAKEHEAHMLVAIMGKETDVIKRGKLLVQVISSFCKQKYTTGIYTSGTVYQPKFYRDFSMVMKDDQLPIINWIWFGLYHNETQKGFYTYGMSLFGKDEIEMYTEKDCDMEDIRSCLFDMVHYVLDSDVTLLDGETIGFTAEQKLPITRSGGTALDGMTLKIPYQEEC